MTLHAFDRDLSGPQTRCSAPATAIDAGAPESLSANDRDHGGNYVRDPDQPDPTGSSHGAVRPALRSDVCAAALQVDRLERARKLSRRLRVEVSIDTTGWLRNEIEVVVDKALDGTLRPVKVRVGADATDEAALERGGAIADCERYNAALARLRQLAEQCTKLVLQGRVRMAPGSPLAYAHRELCRLDELIAHRQRVTMGHGIIVLRTLHREIEFFVRCDAHLTPIVLAAEEGVNASAPHDRLVARPALDEAQRGQKRS